MNLYICATPIHFPRSEYGGQLVVMAESKKNLGKIIKKHYEREVKGDYFDLSLSVKTCKELKLDPAELYSEGIVSEFIT